MPTGGAAGTVLTKNSATDFDAIWAAVSGGAPSGPAGGDLAGTYPNPTLAPAQKNLWQVAGAALTPIDATKGIAIPGGTTHASLVLGPRTVKGRVFSDKNLDAIRVVANRDLNAAENAWVQDDTTKPSWGLQFDVTNDRFQIERNAANMASSAVPLVLDSGGNQTITGSHYLGGGYGSLLADANATQIHFNNYGAPVDPSKNSWLIQMYSNNNFYIYRRPPGSAAGTLTMPFHIDGATDKTYCSLANASVTPAMLVAGATYRNSASANMPSGFNSGTATLNAWILVGSVAITTSGGPVIFNATCCQLFIGGSGNTQPNCYVGLSRDGAGPGPYIRINNYTTAGGIAFYHCPTQFMLDVPPAGAHTYKLWCYLTNTAWTFQTLTDAPGYLTVYELC